MQKALIVALVFTIVLSSFALLGSGGARAEDAVPTRTVQDNAIHLYLNEYFPNSAEPTSQYFTVSYKEINLTMRVATLSSSNAWDMPGTSSKPWKMQASNENHTLKLSGSDGTNNIEVDINFGTWKDAEGADTLFINATMTTNNESYFNITHFILDTEDFTQVDTSLLLHINSLYGYSGYEYSMNWAAGMSYIPLKNNRFLFTVSNSAILGYWYHNGIYMHPEYQLDYLALTQNHSLYSAVKVVHTQTPKTAPKTLMLNPFLNYSRWAIYDNESIYKIAAQKYHIERLILWDNWFKTPSYDFYNNTVKMHVLNIINYAHKYGIKVGMYFGWRDGTSYGWYHPLQTYNKSAIQAMQQSWQTWKSKYYNLVDFIAWDYGGIKTVYTPTWAFWNWYYISLIWKTIDKPIMYNAIFTWYVGDNYIPMRFESPSAVEKIYNANTEDFIGFYKNFGYPQVIFSKGLYDNAQTYNSTRANKLQKYIYLYNAEFMPLYYFGSQKGFTPNIDSYKDIVGNMYMYHDIQGVAGDENVQLENTHEIRLLLTDTEQQITVTPHVAKLPVKIYSNKTVTIEYKINPSPNLVVKDLTTGQTVHWKKGSVIFTAQAGHTYEIEDVVQHATTLTIDAGTGLMLAVIPLVMFAMFFRFFGEAMHELHHKISIRK